MNRARLGWAFTGAGAFWGAIALGGIASMNRFPAAMLLFAIPGFLAPFAVGHLAKRRHPELSAAGLGIGVFTGLFPASIIITAANQLLPEQSAAVLLVLPVAFAACVGGAYLGAGFSIPPREYAGARVPDGEGAGGTTARALTPEGVRQLLGLERRVMFGSAGVTLLALLLITRQVGLFESSQTFGIVFVTMMLVVLVVSQRNVFRRKRASWESLRISLDEERLTRRVADVPDVEIRLGEVTRLQEGTFGLTVRGQGRQAVVFIPSGLEDYAEIRQRLAQLREVEPVRTRLRIVGSLLISLAVLAGMFGFMFSDSAAYVALSGTFMVGLMVWSFFELGRSRHADWRLKRLRWFFLPVALGMAARVAYVLGSW